MNKPYMEEINSVQDYIDVHLDETLTVKNLSEVANLSEYHFSRIYGLVTGETLYGYIKRLRLERATYMLLADTKRSITDIALSNGFSNQASFAKAFKGMYGISASNYRKQGYHFPVNEQKIKPSVIEPESPIGIIKEKPMSLIYVRYTGKYQGDGKLFAKLFNELFSWAQERDLISQTSRWFVIYHDYGNETEANLLRFSVCMSVEGNVATSEGVGRMELPAMTYAVGNFYVTEKEYDKAWRYMYTKWLPTNTYRAADSFSLEHYPNAPMKEDKRLVEIYIPVESNW